MSCRATSRQPSSPPIRNPRTPMFAASCRSVSRSPTTAQRARSSSPEVEQRSDQTQMRLAAEATLGGAVRTDENVVEVDPLGFEKRGHGVGDDLIRLARKALAAEAVLVGHDHEPVARVAQREQRGDDVGNELELLQAIDLLVFRLDDQRAVTVDEDDAARAGHDAAPRKAATSRGVLVGRADGDPHAAIESELRRAIADDDAGRTARVESGTKVMHADEKEVRFAGEDVVDDAAACGGLPRVARARRRAGAQNRARDRCLPDRARRARRRRRESAEDRAHGLSGAARSRQERRGPRRSGPQPGRTLSKGCEARPGSPSARRRWSRRIRRRPRPRPRARGPRGRNRASR